MPTLVLSAPRSQVQDNKQSFHKTIQTGIGRGYGISEKDYKLLTIGDPVIVLCKDDRKQAAGQIEKIEPTVKHSHDLQRYDVHLKGLNEVEYTGDGIKLRRKGVTLI